MPSFGSFEDAGYRRPGIRTFPQKRFTKVLLTKRGARASSTFRILTATACVLRKSLKGSPESGPLQVGRNRAQATNATKSDSFRLQLQQNVPPPFRESPWGRTNNHHLQEHVGAIGRTFVESSSGRRVGLASLAQRGREPLAATPPQSRAVSSFDAHAKDGCTHVPDADTRRS